MTNPLDLFAWRVRTERKRQHLTQKQLAERLGMNPRTIIDLENCQSNPKFETVVDSFVVKSEAEIEKYIALCRQAEAFQKDE